MRRSIRHWFRFYRAAGLPASFLLDCTITGLPFALAVALLVMLSLSACKPAQRLSSPPAASAYPSTPTRLPTPVPSKTVRATLQPTQPPATPMTPAAPAVCSPLDGIKVADLASLIVNPFHPPPPGSDDPHQGVDLADLIPGSGVARAGRGVQAVLAGRVASVIHDRFPYGNAILVETPLQGLPAAWLETLPVPTLAPTLAARSPLTCPTPQAAEIWDLAQRSLYLLYAHMQQAPALPPGEAVSCGEKLGAVGSSGNALNPHLHLEARLGPLGADFDSMAHYTTSASPAEMRAYCDWRISGLFQLIDPMRIFTAAP